MSAISKVKSEGLKVAKVVGDRFTRVGKSLTLGVTLPVVGLGTALIKTASDAEETASKFGVVFSDISGDAQKAFKTLRNEYGLSSNASKQLLSDTGDLLTGFGFTQETALDLSTQVNKLAVDLASFTNFSGGAEGASKALTKALLGERESVKSLGISILEVDVNAKMLENSQKGLTFETERQAKAFATLQLAQEQSKNAIGDFARTQDSFANQMRVLKERIKDVATEFGNELMPLAKQMVGVAQSVVDRFSKMSAEGKKLSLIIAGIAAAVGPTLLIIGSFAKALVSLNIIIPKVVIAMKALTSTMMANPYLAVAGAIALIATRAYLAFRRARELNNEIKDALTLDVTTTALTDINDTIKTVKEEIKDLQGSNRQGILGVSMKDQQRLTELNEKLTELKNQRAEIAMGLLKNELENTSDEAGNTSDSVISLTNSYKDFMVVAKQVNDQPIFDPLAIDNAYQMQKSVENLYTPLSQLMDVPINLPEKMFPPGSLGFLNESLANLRTQLLMATDPEIISGILSKIESTEEQIRNLTGTASESAMGMAVFADVLGQVFSQAVLHARNLQDVLKNVLKQLASKAFVTGIGILLTGGFSGFKDIFKGGFGKGIGKLIGIGDGMITGDGTVVKMHPNDKMFAMKDGRTPNMGGGNISEGSMSRAFEMAMDRKLNKLGPREIYALSQEGKYN